MITKTQRVDVVPFVGEHSCESRDCKEPAIWWLDFHDLNGDVLLACSNCTAQITQTHRMCGDLIVFYHNARPPTTRHAVD